MSVQGLSARVSSAQQRGIRWLERHLRLLSEVREPYALALVAHALTCSRAPSAEHAYRLLLRLARYDGTAHLLRPTDSRPTEKISLYHQIANLQSVTEQKHLV